MEQLDRIGRSLAGHKDPASDVHNARKGLKRLRALLRLVRPAIAEPQFRRENLRLRDISRRLSGTREVHVMRQSLETLRGVPGAGLVQRRRALDALEALIAAHSVDQGEEVRPGVAAKARAELDAGRAFWRSPGLFTGACDAVDAAIVAGSAATYRRCRRAFATAIGAGGDEDFHEARKAIQYHWRHMVLLAPAWPEHFHARSTEARRLAQLLGEDHDMAVLREFVTAAHDGHHTVDRASMRTIVELARDRQHALRRQARPRAGRLLALPAKALAQEIAAALECMRAASGSPAEAERLAS